MNNLHRRTLLAIRQSAEFTTFELQAGETSCSDSDQTRAKCIGCSRLVSGAESGVSQRIVFPTTAIRYQNAEQDQNTEPNQNGQNRGNRSEKGTIRVGDSVVLEAPSGLLLALSSVIYLVPVILMLFFAVSCGFLYSDSEAAVAVSAAIGLGIGLGAIILIEPALRLLITKKLHLSIDQ